MNNNYIELNKSPHITADQAAQIHRLCARGCKVEVTAGHYKYDGKILQYATLFPDGKKDPQTCLFLEDSLFKLSGRDEVIRTVGWQVIDRISWWNDDSSQGVDPTISKIKTLVFNSLKHPQPKGASEQLVRMIGNNSSAVIGTVDYCGQAVLLFRMIPEYIRRGELDKAKNLFQDIVKNNMWPSTPSLDYDFSFAIFSLLKAGDSITVKSKPYPQGDLVDWVFMAYDKTRPKQLQQLFEWRYISAEDIEKMQKLRQDPKVKAWFTWELELF